MTTGGSRAVLASAMVLMVTLGLLIAGRTASAARPRTGAADATHQASLLKLDPASTTHVFDSAQAARTVKVVATAACDQTSHIASVQTDIAESLPADTSVLFCTHSLMAGLAVNNDSGNLNELKSLPGVKAVYPIAPKTVANSYAVPLQGAPAAWSSIDPDDLGQDSTIAIIDTGIDYTHANFGGPGTKVAYETAHEHEADDPDSRLVPNDKVVSRRRALWQRRFRQE